MNPYEILGIPPSASEQQIKSAYRRRARETHPDAGGDGADFALVSKAHAILMDPEARKRFDETGSIDEIAPLTVRQRMIQILAAILQEALRVEGERGTSFDHFDFMTPMREAVAINRKQAEANHQRLARASRNQKILLKRIVRKGDGENVFETVIRQNLQQLEPILKASDLDCRAFDMAADELQHYKSDVELFQAMQMMQFGGNFRAQNQSGNSVFFGKRR